MFSSSDPPWKLYSGIQSGNVYGIVILTFFLTYFLAYILTFFLASCEASSLTFYAASFQAFIQAFYLVYLRRFFVVQFTRGALWSGARGWGPVGNTLFWSLRWKSSGGKGGGDGTADIKTNNPHLTGGEKTATSTLPFSAEGFER